MRLSGRACFRGQGYVYATRAEEIARKHGHVRTARLASNENPFPPPPRVLERAREALKEANRYPPERHETLLGALRDSTGWEHLVVGNGMDGVIETVLRALIEPGDAVAIATPTFSYYGIAAMSLSARVIAVERRPDFHLDRERFLRQASGARVAFLCTPNNPTGTVTPPGMVEEILGHFEGLLFLDNAYVEFSDVDYTGLMEGHDNLVIGRTMSKAYSLAGLRFGYALVPEWLEPLYERAATPFAVNRVTAAAAEAALREKAHLERSIAHARAWRERFIRDSAFPAYPSGANFVLFDVSPMSGEEAMEKLAARGVLVRSCSSFPGLGEHYIRVSVGEDWENEQFLRALREI